MLYCRFWPSRPPERPPCFHICCLSGSSHRRHTTVEIPTYMLPSIYILYVAGAAEGGTILLQGSYDYHHYMQV